jgi:uracil-DNA glycosylase family 4
MSRRSKKIVKLSKFCDLESGNLNESAFEELDILYEKGKRYHKLSQRIRCCNKCPGMNIGRVTECCPGWGDLNANVMFVGQSLHEPGMYSQIPFILGSGLIVDTVLRLSKIDRHNCFWTNAVLCHPERNRPSTEEEKENCWPHLAEMIDIVQPRIAVSFGKDAKLATKKYKDKYGNKGIKWLNYVHPASLIYSQPEARPNYIVKMSLDIDRALEKI